MNTPSWELQNIKDVRERLGSTFEQLHKLIHGYYGYDLKIKIFPSEPDYHERVLMNLIQKNFPLKMPDKMYFPVKVEDRMIGAIEILGTRQITLEKFERIKQTIDLVLTAKLQNSGELQMLKRLEAQLRQKLSPRAHNIVVLSDYRKVKSDNSQTIFPQAQRVAFNVPCLIRSSSAEDIPRMANEIHALSQRYAFLNIDDLDTRKMIPESFQDMGPVNIFIPELADLSAAHQSLIMNYLRYHRRKTSPQIIAGSVHSNEDLTDKFGVSTELLTVLSTGHLEMREPFQKIREKGITQFFYQCLVKRNQ